jgi:hypothetical protein
MITRGPRRASGRARPAPLAILMLLAGPALASSPETQRIEQLEAEVDALREQLTRLEAKLVSVTRTPAERAAGGVTVAGTEILDGAAIGAERANQAAAPVASEPAGNDGFEIGGALRFTGYYQGDRPSSDSKWGQAGLDIFRINVDGERDGFLLSAEYRYYPYMHTIRYGWVGYEFDEAQHLEAGITRVPFGLLPYASHSFWFGSTYYLGLEDDSDLGLKYVRRSGPLDLQLAFFKNEELGDATNLARYAYDVVRVGDAQNEESNRLNGRIAYTFDAGSDCQHEVGVSGQWGQLYNATTDRNGDHWAAAAHLDSRCGRWNLQLEAARYEYAPKNPAGLDDGLIRLGAFEGSYDVASRANVLVANLAYNFDVDGTAIDSLLCYNDYSVVLKDPPGFADSHLNTTGCAIGAGPLFVYLDYILARNMVFFGNGSLADGGDRSWDSRFNVNVGYYW